MWFKRFDASGTPTGRVNAAHVVTVEIAGSGSSYRLQAETSRTGMWFYVSPVYPSHAAAVAALDSILLGGNA